MNLRSIDLNLLVILDALLDEAHVSRAAARLALSQPATSSALDRCRFVFKDRLLERHGASMKLTAKAQALRAPLKDALASLSRVVDTPSPDLKTLTRIVRVAMADAPAASIVAGAYTRLRQSAPGVTLVVVPWHSAGDALHALEQADIDLALSVIPPVSGNLRRSQLLTEDYVVAMRRSHPAAARFDLDKWLDHPHVLVSSRGETRGALDEALLKHRRSRRVAMVVPSFLLAMQLLDHSDCIAMLPRRSIDAASRKRLAVFEPPIAVEGFAMHIAWHARSDDDLAVGHVAEVLRHELLNGGA
jgi:DNA-binding transcriptional LysR family regulator